MPRSDSSPIDVDTARNLPERFRTFRQFNDPDLHQVAGSLSTLSESTLRHFASDSLADRIARELGRRRALSIKEVVESFEFFQRVERALRAPRVADLFCGHGLVGMLFAACCEQVEQVILVDARRPASFQDVWDSVHSIAPWVSDKVVFLESAFSHLEPLFPGTSVVGVHACGERTDQVLEAAVQAVGRVAVMPCCYVEPQAVPGAVRRALGSMLASDVDRTYRLERSGYRVKWSLIPSCVTPMNRILIGDPPR